MLLLYDALLLLFTVSTIYRVNYLSDLGSDDLDRMEDAYEFVRAMLNEFDPWLGKLHHVRPVVISFKFIQQQLHDSRHEQLHPVKNNNYIQCAVGVDETGVGQQSLQVG